MDKLNAGASGGALNQSLTREDFGNNQENFNTTTSV
jgi:hypothetical protein